MQCATDRVLCALTVTVAVSCAAVAGTAESPAQKARKALDAGEPRQAAQILQEAVTAKPSDVSAQAALAEALLLAGSSDHALKVAKALVAATPADPAAARSLGLVLGARYEFDEALRVMDAALARHPDSGALLSAKGRVLWWMKRTSSAIDALKKAARDPSYAGDAQQWLGQIYFYRGWQSEGAFPGWHEEPEYRDQAKAAFQAAAKARPDWWRPHAWMADSLVREGKPGDALQESDAAILRAQNIARPRVSRWRALKDLGRTDTLTSEIADAAKSDDVRKLAAAREGYVILGDEASAQAIAARIAEKDSTSDAVATVLSGRIEAARKAKQYSTVIEQVPVFARRFPANRDLPVVYDALLEAYQATPSVTPDQIAAAIDARIKHLPDPGVYVQGANLLLARRALLDRVVTLAEASVPAAERFINENIGAYKMQGKVEGSRNRSRATAADLVGWAKFLEGDVAAASAKLSEAERLSRGADMANQFHLAELARSKGQLEPAREYYLTALTLQGPPPIKDAAKKSLSDVYAKLGNSQAEFETYLKSELDRRREERREALTRSMIDKPVPALKLTDLSGRSIEIGAQRGKVLLLNFFASW